MTVGRGRRLGFFAACVLELALCAGAFAGAAWFAATEAGGGERGVLPSALVRPTLVFAALLGFALAASGLWTRRAALAGARSRRLAGALALALLGCGVFALFASADVRRILPAGAAGAGASLLCSRRWLGRLGRRLRQRPRVFLVGPPHALRPLCAQAAQGEIDVSGFAPALTPDLAERMAGAADAIVLAPAATASREAAAGGSRLPVLDEAEFQERFLGRVVGEPLGRTGLTPPAVAHRHDGAAGLLGRALALAIGAPVLLLLGPALLLLAVLCRLLGPGGLVVRVHRQGRGDRTFALLAPGDHFAGRALRAFGIDKLLALEAVWRGHLALVGPRPLSPTAAHNLARRSPEIARARRLVPPGVWSWSGPLPRESPRGPPAPLGGELDHLLSRELPFDRYYLRHASPALDLRVLARPVRRALFGSE